MILQVEFTWLVGLFVLFVLAAWALGKVLIGQFDKRLDERFATQEVARTEAQEHWENRFSQIETLARSTDRDMLLMRGDLPNQYTRREDTIRNQSVLEARMDALMNEVKMIRIEGGK
jgi:hypothetical protein